MARKPSILCVDDRADSLLIRKLMLQQFGCDVVAVNDAPSCLDVLNQHAIDVVLIDYHLAAQTTGEALAHMIRKRWPSVALVMLTGDPKIPDSARESVDAVLIKGASDPKDMMDLIEHLVPEAALRPRRSIVVPDSPPKAL